MELQGLLAECFFVFLGNKFKKNQTNSNLNKECNKMFLQPHKDQNTVLKCNVKVI